MAEQQVVAAGAGCDDVDSGENAFVRQFPVELELHVARAFEFFENHFVHLRACFCQSRGDDGQAAAVFDVARCSEKAFRLLQGIGVDAAGENFARSGRNGVVGAGKAGDGIEQDDDIMPAFYHAFCLFKHESRDFHVAVGRLVERGSDNFGVDAASHVGHFLGALVDQQDDHVGVGVVLRDGIGNIFEQDGFACLRRGDDESALSFSDRREHVDDAGRNVACLSACQIEFFIGE